MLPFKVIEEEVRSVFGDKVDILINYFPNYDGVDIRVMNRSHCNKVPCVTAGISGLEMLQEEDPLTILRYRINKMYTDMNKLLEEKGGDT